MVNESLWSYLWLNNHNSTIDGDNLRPDPWWMPIPMENVMIKQHFHVFIPK